jgi:cytochrome P450
MSLIGEPCRSIAAPVLGIDSYAIEVIENPYPFHARLRDAGPVALIAPHQVYAAGRLAEASAVLSDHARFTAVAGIGIQDIRKPDETGLHVRFGMGAHICIGQMIARLEAESILKAIVAAADRLEPAGESRYRPVDHMRQLDHLPLRAERQ